MGRDVKRVSLNFDWPLEKIWDGYLNPYHNDSRNCPFCEGSGENPETKQLADDWYDSKNTGRRWVDTITQDEVDALVAGGRLMGFTHRWTKENGWQPKEPPCHPTAEQVNTWSASRGMGHDAINRWICVETRAKRLGVFGDCGYCKGGGTLWLTLEAKDRYELWEETEPPAGDGWQVWENVSEGSPVTPVFDTAEALADYLAEGGDSACRRRGGNPPSYEAALNFIEQGSCMTMVMGDGQIKMNIDSCEGIAADVEPQCP